jgi:AAA ATPase domain
VALAQRADGQGNPYDFRSAVRAKALLAGRDEELSGIDSLLRESALGRPVHFSLFGGEGCGKSSLLNAVVEIAIDRGLLAFKVVLREALIESELAFYRAIYDAALQALIGSGRLAESDPLMHAWLLESCTGLVPTAVTEQNLELGMLVAASMNGRPSATVPVSLVVRDLTRMASLGERTSAGVVMCLDGAQHVDGNRDLAPSLMQLADATPLITIATAAEEAGTLQQTASRSWAQIEIRPFQDPGQVLEAIAKPMINGGDHMGAAPPTPATANDIFQLTGGVPYEVNLVCHFIWDAIQQGEQEQFELSPAVIQRVTAELEEKGRHQATSAIATYGGLTDSDYTALAEIAPYEALTVRQLALLRLMPEEYSETGLRDSEARVQATLAQLAAKGVVRLEQDRFEFSGGRDARVYLKYAAKSHTGNKLIYGDTYVRAATAAFAQELGHALIGDSYDASRLLGRWRRWEVGGMEAASWLDTMAQAARGSDIVALADTVAAWSDPGDLAGCRDDDFVLWVVKLQAGLHEVEYLELLVNRDGHPADELRARADRWIAENEQLLSTYDVSFLTWGAEPVRSEVIRGSRAYWQLGVANQASYLMYRAGATDAADALLAATIELSQELVGSHPTDPLLRTRLSSAHLRRGFMAATRGEWPLALAQLEASRLLALTDGDSWLLAYNEGYVRAMNDDFDQAARLMAEALETYDEHADRVLLHAYLMPPSDWEPGAAQWNVVEINQGWIKRFVDLQLKVVRARVSPSDRDVLAAELESLSPSAPVPLLRLAGWAYLESLDEPAKALDCFARAVLLTPHDQPQIAKLEAVFAEARLFARAEDTGESAAR